MSRGARGEERNSWRVRNNPVETKTRIASTIDWRRHISTIAQYGSHCDRGAAKSAIMFIKLAGRKGVWGWGGYSSRGYTRQRRTKPVWCIEPALVPTEERKRRGGWVEGYRAGVYCPAHCLPHCVTSRPDNCR